jgi:hypothetical protein
VQEEDEKFWFVSLSSERSVTVYLGRSLLFIGLLSPAGHSSLGELNENTPFSITERYAGSCSGVPPACVTALWCAACVYAVIGAP